MSHIVVKQNDMHVLFLTTVFSNIQARYFHHISMFFSYTWMSLTCTRLNFISETTFDAQINICPCKDLCCRLRPLPGKVYKLLTDYLHVCSETD